MNEDHIVDFTFCKTCKYEKLSESEDPCWGCLDNPINQDSRRPINYHERDNQIKTKTNELKKSSSSKRGKRS